MAAATELAADVGVTAACDALGVSRATWYRKRSPRQEPAEPRPTPARALDKDERKQVLDTLCSERFVDRAPAEVVATLLSEGTWLCSERTMYRILADHAPVRERRNQLNHPEYVKPELVATGPNQVWSWDITKLRGPQKWTYYYLYVVLDLYSRYVIGWMVAERETAALAGRLIEESCAKHDVAPDTLVLHSDRGSPMTAKCTAQLLADLGITRSLSRPRVSDDNPYSEAHFKTVKYHPTFPGTFDSKHQALTHARRFFPWYNDEHQHAGIAMLTPADVHFGRAETVLAQRQTALDAAHTNHPDRFVHGPPRVRQLPPAVWINKPKPEPDSSSTEAQ